MMIHTHKENFVSVKCSSNTSSRGYFPIAKVSHQLNGDNDVSLPGLCEALHSAWHMTNAQEMVTSILTWEDA